MTVLNCELSPENIDKASEEIVGFLESFKIESAEITRIRLGCEETLLRYSQEDSSYTSFELRLFKRFGTVKVQLLIAGKMFDPLIRGGSPEENSAFMRAALTNMGELPIWRYFGKSNIIQYSVKKKHINSWMQLIIAICLAFISSFILNTVVPENITAFIHGSIISPLLDTFMNLLSGIAGPMIFLAIIWGIYSIGDVSAFSVMGKKHLGRMLVFAGILSVGLGLAMLPFFVLRSGSVQLGDGFSALLKMLLDIVPGNVILPFTEGNTLQILFVGIVMGIAMIIIGEKTRTVAIFAEQLNYIVQIIMEFISKLVPFFVFGSLLDIILSNELKDISVSYKLFVTNAAACFALFLIYVVFVSIRLKVNPLVYVSKAFKTLLICFTTASSAAAFSTSLETCRDSYGIDESLTNFGVPFTQVIFKPSVAILYFTSAIYAAEVFHVNVSLTWFATAFLMSILLSVATPPIPGGGALAGISVLFAQLGLPTEGIAVVLALNIILDFFETPTDVFGGHSVLILSANRFGLINTDVLRKKRTE